MADLNIGNSSASVVVNAKHNGSVIPQINNTYDLGTSTLKWKNIYGSTFVGSLNGNAATATKATQDSANQQINTTYIKGLSASGRTITYTKGDGTTGTITTQDSNTTYSAGTGLVLSGTKFSIDSTVITKDSMLQTTNPFGGSSLYISKIDNAFYAADKRWTVTGSYTGSSSGTYSISQLSALFDGNYETALVVPKGCIAKIRITFDTNETGTHGGAKVFPGYPYGYAYISYYYNATPSTPSKMRMYCNYEPHVIGEHEYTMSTFNGSYSSPGASSGNSAVVEYVRQPNYAMSYIEFEINGATNYDVRITQIEMRLERPDSSKTPFLSKYGAETLYYPLTAPQFNGNLSGNALTATKLQTARTISLIGSITGSGTFDGSGNLSIATTTNHTHNYAGSASAGGPANSVKTSLIIKLNGGTNEGNNLFTFNGSAAKTINITPAAIGASASDHTHDDRYYGKSEIDEALVAPDWNQNDETAHDYIKNRPFYTDDPVETVLLDNVSVTIEADGDGIIETQIAFTEGDTYKVEWNGTVYECVAYIPEAEAPVVIGNGDIWGLDGGNGEPFIMYSTGRALSLSSSQEPGTYTVSIAGKKSGIHEIDKKYLGYEVITTTLFNGTVIIGVQ